MPQFINNKRLIVLMVSIIILVAVIGFSMRDRDNISLPEQLFRDGAGFAQSVLSKPAYIAVDFFTDASFLLNVYQENQTLKARVDEAASISAELAGVRQENETLREMVDQEESLTDYSIRAAQVIHRSPDHWTETIGIDKGSQNGIEPDMAVMTPEGLIGRVQSTSQFTSTVQLLSDGDDNNRVSAMVTTDGDPVYAFIEGWDEEREGLMLRKIESDAEIEEGQLVSTSGLGGIFPRGLAIGEIVNVEPDEYGLTYNALVEPAAGFYNIEQVTVIERSSESLDEDLEEEAETSEEEEEEEEPVDVTEEGGG